MAGQHESVGQMVEAALAMSASEREAYLQQAGRSAPELRRHLEQLLLDRERAGSSPPEKPLLPGLGSGADSSVEGSQAETLGVTELRLVKDPASRFQCGDTLAGRFVIVRFIARGGMGEVYEVEDRLLQGVHVALKVLLPESAGNPAGQRRFEQEVLLARQVTHPNLCPIYDIFYCQQPAPAFSFLTMKLLSGDTLASRFSAGEALPREEADRIFSQMTAGLAAIHAAGIVHRDIKPNNVMLQGHGAGLHLWITDFGLARLFEAEPTMLTTEGISGTPGYIAPELFHGGAPTQASDVFGYGVLLHQVFTGERPALKPGSFSAVPSARLKSASVPPAVAELVPEFLADDPLRRCRAFERARQLTKSEVQSSRSRHAAAPFWTRRRFLEAGAVVAGLTAAGVDWKWKLVEDQLHPLPAKRFVALVTWPPTPNLHVRAMLTGVIDAIEGELSRAEAFDRNLFVISPRDMKDLGTAAQLSELRDSLGANLVLAASGTAHPKKLRLSLQVLDPSSTRALREKRISCATGQEMSLPDKAVHAAAEMLNVGEHPRKTPPANPGTQSADAFAAFQTAEALRKQENDSGLDEAIEKYKQALELDPKYALAYAKLALAYGRYYAVHRDQAALLVARRNYEAALSHMPELVEAHLAKAFVLELTGDETAALHALAKALSLDPSNPRILLEQAQIFDRLNLWANAESTFERVLRQRPNYWQAYNALGAVYSEQGKFREAIDAFRQASVAAPKVAIAYNNIASIHLQMGNDKAAIEYAKKSLDLKQNALAADTMAAALRLQRRSPEALRFASRAVELDPADPTAWVEMGDCEAALPGHLPEARSAYLRGAQVQKEQVATDATYGPGWILLGLCQAKCNLPGPALTAIRKADSLPADDLDSQLYKARALEAIGMRDDALATLRRCFKRGATRFQVELMPDMGSLRADSRYKEMVRGDLPAPEQNA